MKNKVISAMLLGMSATMAVPGTVVMAAEDGSESTAVEETAAEVPETEGGESEAEQNDEESQDKQDTDTAVQKMIDYATDESAKVADTPADFGPKLSNIVFSDDVFGKYADSLNEYINGSEVDTGSIYNCEMDMVDKVAELTKDESAEAIAASKYQVALTFESVYGEDAFMPGRDIRRALIADSSKDEDFAVCGTIAEADTVYISAGGTTTIPATLFKATPEQPESPDETDATDSPNDTDSVTKDEDQNGADDSTTEETPSDTTNPDTPGDVTTDSDSTEEEKRSLDEYVEGLDDIEIQLGDDLPSPRVSYDDTKVVSVSLDTSKVDKNTIGVYTISYIIKGVDGTTKIVNKQCAVSEDPVLKELRKQMCEKAGEIEKGKFTEKDFKSKWDEAVKAAKAEINKKKNEEEMQAVLDKLTETAASILNDQQLYVTKNGYVGEMYSKFESMEFVTDAQKNMANDVLKDAVAKIKKSETVEDAKQAMDEGIENIEKIAAQDDSSIDALKSEAKKKINAAMDGIKDKTTVLQNVYGSLIFKLDTCTTAKEIDSVTNSAGSAFAHVKAAIEGDMDSMFALYKDLKGIAPDSDTTETIDEIILLGTPSDISDGEDKISDIHKAITSDVDEFTAYLTGRAGETISGETKAEAYAAYVKATNGTPDADLTKVKEDAKSEIQKALDEITSDNEEVTDKKGQIKDKVFKKIDAAASAEEVETIVSDAKSEIKDLKDEITNNEGLNSVKESAKKEIQNTVDNQSDEELKASIQQLAGAALKKIENATTEDEVKDIVEGFKSDVQTTTDAYKKDKELASVKADTLSKLSVLESKVKSEYVTADMNSIISTAKANIENAQSASECSKIYAQAKTDYNNAYLTSMRSVFNNKLDALLTEYKFTDDTYSQKAQEVINKQKENINKAKNETAMEKCYSLAKDNLAKLVTAQDAAAKLAQLRADAISTLQKRLDTVPSDKKEDAQKVFDSYVEKINSDTTEDAIKNDLEEGKTKLKKYGASDVTDNTPTPNGNTSTTLDGSGSGATEKGSDVATTSGVKTGDDNMSIIAIAGAAIMAALAAAFISLKKFIKR